MAQGSRSQNIIGPLIAEAERLSKKLVDRIRIQSGLCLTDDVAGTSTICDSAIGSLFGVSSP